MKVTVAIDSFKGSLSTFQSGSAVKEGILRVFPGSSVDICPLADGGEGTVSAVVSAADGEMQAVSVHNPLGEIITAEYGIVHNTKTAIMEMSAAAGITLIEEKDRNPLFTTTYGVGEMISDAIRRGCRNFIIGIGGSATNDGGVGMLQALGFEFVDSSGKQVSFGAKGLESIAEIRTDNANPHIRECDFRIACDVKNVLCGANGCSAVYGPQKGADEAMISEMDLWLERYAKLTRSVNPDADPDFPGAGAAGGMGFAFLAYLNGRLTPGIELVMSATGLEGHITDSDIVITGEGRLDGQSCMGKAPVGVAKLAKAHGKPVIAFSGCVTDDARLCNEHGIDAFFPILKAPCSLSEAMDIDNAYKNLRDTAEQAFRLIKTFSQGEKI